MSDEQLDVYSSGDVGLEGITILKVNVIRHRWLHFHETIFYRILCLH